MDEKRIKTAILSSGSGTMLQSVIDTLFFGEIGHMELSAVITDSPECMARDRAALARLPSCVVEREMFPSGKSFDKALLDKLDDLDTDFVVLSDWDYPLPREILVRWPRSILCLWPSLLPAWGEERLAPMEIQERVLQSGAQLTGATACLLETDGLPGPILLQRSVAIQPGDTPEKLLRRVNEEAGRLILPEAMGMFCSGRLCIHGKQTKLLPPL